MKNIYQVWMGKRLKKGNSHNTLKWQLVEMMDLMTKQNKELSSSKSGEDNEEGSSGEKRIAEETENENIQCYGGAHVNIRV